MVAKHEEQLYVTERQKQQIKRSTGILRQLNRAVLGELRRIMRHNQTDRRYNEVGVLLETAASQIISLLRFREGILSSARNEPRVLVVKIGVIGGRHNAFPEDLMYPTGELVPPLDPAHYLELEKLLEFAFRIGERLCSHNIRSKTFPSAFVVGLRRLTDALLKQQRHLRETTPAPSAVRTEIRDYTGDGQKRAKTLEERRGWVSPVEISLEKNETGDNYEE